LLETACSYYLKEDFLYEKNMVFRAANKSLSEIESLAHSLVSILKNAGINCEVIENKTQIGGGSLPGNDVQSRAVLLHPDLRSKKDKVEYAENMHSKLLLHSNPVLGILKQGNIIFDVMTIEEHETDIIAKAIIDVHSEISEYFCEKLNSKD